MEEAPENGKESSNSAHANWVNEWLYHCHSVNSSGCFFSGVKSTQPSFYGFLVKCFFFLTFPLQHLGFQFPLPSDMSVRFLLFPHFLSAVFLCLSLWKGLTVFRRYSYIVYKIQLMFLLRGDNHVTLGVWWYTVWFCHMMIWWSSVQQVAKEKNNNTNLIVMWT